MNKENKPWIVVKWVAMFLLGAGFIAIIEIISRKELYPHIYKK